MVFANPETRSDDVIFCAKTKEIIPFFNLNFTGIGFYKFAESVVFLLLFRR